MRVGLVGCGFIARAHTWALWALGRAGRTDAKVVAVADPVADRAAEMAQPHDARIASSTGELLDEVDAVFVCTPTASHLEVVEAAADRGLAVFCEKPLAPSLDAAERVAAALARVPHQVGLVLRYAPVFGAIAERLDGRFGPTMAVHLRDDQYLPNQGIYGSSWREDVDVAGGGTLIEHSIHDLDLFRWFLGDPSGVSCRTASFADHRGIEDVAHATLAYPDGNVASLLSVWHQVLSRTSTRRVEVFCEQALLWTDDDNTGPLHVETSAGDEVVECAPPDWVAEMPVPDPVRKPLGLYAAADLAFLEAAARGENGFPTQAEALAAHRLVDACYRSAASA